MQIAALTYFLYYVLKQEGTPEITFQELVNDFLRYGYIERLQVVNKETCRVLLRNDVTLPQNLGSFLLFAFRCNTSEVGRNQQ